MKKQLKNCTTFQDHLTKHYGKTGSAKRTKFETKAIEFVNAEIKTKSKFL
ncbi:hypothetical protein [Flavobacterium subsaxonicum]|nr:hypothetical protein [Flavobacterium subsaxonicum]